MRTGGTVCSLRLLTRLEHLALGGGFQKPTLKKRFVEWICSLGLEEQEPPGEQGRQMGPLAADVD